MQQLLLSLELQPSYSREDYILTALNQRTFDCLLDIPKWPEPTLILSGPEGSGKTHLAHIWSAEHRGTFLSLVNLTLEGLNNLVQLVEVPHFIVDGIERADALLLFHLYNMVKERSGKLLLTSTFPLDEKRWHLPDLLSRLRASPLLTLQEPDDETLRLMLFKTIHDSQLILSEDVADYLLLRVDRNYSSLRRIIRAIDEKTLREKRPITVPLIRSLM